MSERFIPVGKEIRKLRFTDYIVTTEHQGELLQVPPYTWERGLRMHPDRQAHLRERIQATSCPYCSSGLAVSFQAPESGDDGFTFEIMECGLCGFWKAKGWSGIAGPQWITPLVHNFVPQRHIAALNALFAEIEGAPSRLYEMTPRAFELFVGTVLREFYNCDVRHTGRSHDHGIDLVMIATDDPIMVQVKHRKSPHDVEGIDVVKHLFASLFAQQVQKGALVTSAQRFTKGAKDWIHLPALRDQQFEIELVDVNRLLDMLKACQKDNDEPGWVNAVQTWCLSPYDTILRKFGANNVERPGDKADATIQETFDGICIKLDRKREFLFESSGKRPRMASHTARLSGL